MAPRGPRAAQEGSGGASGVIRGRARSPPGSSRGTLGAPGRARGAEKGAQERPKASRGAQNRRQIASGSEKVALFRAFACERRSESVFGRFFGEIRQIEYGSENGECRSVPRLPVEMKVRPLGFTERKSIRAASKNLEN